MRLIDADILDKALTSLRFTADGELAHWGDRKDWCLHGSEIEMLIANAPTIEAEPVRHGEWITVTDDVFADKHYCSACMNYAEVDLYGEEILSKYCLNCGAKMDEVSK